MEAVTLRITGFASQRETSAYQPAILFEPIRIVIPLIATHTDPESCGAARKGCVEALTGERAGNVIVWTVFCNERSPVKIENDLCLSP